MKRRWVLGLTAVLSVVGLAAQAEALSGKDVVNMAYAPCGSLVSTGQYYYLEQNKPIPVLNCIPLGVISPVPNNGAWADIAYQLILRDGTVIPWDPWYNLVAGGTINLATLWASAGYKWWTSSGWFGSSSTMCGLLGRWFRYDTLGDIAIPITQVMCQSKSWSMFNPANWSTWFAKIGGWLLDPTKITQIASLPTELRPRDIVGLDKLMSGLIVSSPSITQSLVTAKLDSRSRVRPMLTTTSTTTPSTQVADTGASSTIVKATGVVCVMSCSTFTYDVPITQAWYKARTAY